ncbi:MAG: amidohydrolase family protein, partial [Clostridiales bacterium]|nr:amidohydrolase family protein [Clostridiales bacterium]
MLLIKNALVFCENGFERGDIAIDGGLFAEIRAAGDGIPGAPPDCEIIDAESCYAIPGLIDIHFHGCMGCDFSSASVGEMSMMARYQARNGVTAICPATMTLPEDALALACGRMAELAARQRGGSQGGAGFGERAGKTGAGGAGAGKIGTVAGGTRASGTGEAAAGASDAGGATAGASGAYYAGAAGARPIEDAESALIGINLEGPFISAEKLGAQNPAYVRPPSLPMFDRLQAASGGLIKLLAIAPETEGAMGMISALRDRVTVSLAHTAAGYSLSKEAFAAGARHVTHLYNAMLPFAHREPGLPGAAFDTPGVMAELICDGVHVHPAAARATFRLLGDSRVALVSDSMMATGLSDGMYELGGLPVRVSGNRAVLASGGGIAGSVTNLMDCLRVAVRDMGIPLHSAVKCASANPARAIGAYG